MKALSTRTTARFWLIAALLHGASCFAQSSAATEHERKVQDAKAAIAFEAKQFEMVLKSASSESDLRQQCALNCAAIANDQSGKTVSDQLQRLQSVRTARLNQIGAAIQATINSYIVHTVSANDPTLERKPLVKDLARILATVSSEQPLAFTLGSDQSRALVVFYSVLNQTAVGSYTTFAAFNPASGHLTLSDQIDRDFDSYSRIEVQELASPVPGELWLLVSGYVTGANGPNSRMRVFAYNGRRFRTVWAPANVWGSFTAAPTTSGFIVRGEYYRSSRRRAERYQLAADGLYLEP